jgi:hypothetical protein
MLKKRITALAGGGAFALFIAALLLWYTPATATAGTVTVYKNPSCGCCGDWIGHMRAAGFEVDVHDVTDLQTIKTENGVTPQIGSCHTALVDGYVVEGHVPADLVQKMLDEKPDIVGLSVPGMVVGSPGMEVPGQPPQPYDVIAFDANGATAVYAKR